MKVRVNLESDPISLVVIAADGTEHVVLDSARGKIIQASLVIKDDERHGENGGVACDTSQEPCACGEWHGSASDRQMIQKCLDYLDWFTKGHEYKPGTLQCRGCELKRELRIYLRHEEVRPLACCWTKDEYGNKCGRAATWMATALKQPYCDQHAHQMRKINATLVALPPNDKLIDRR